MYKNLNYCLSVSRLTVYLFLVYAIFFLKARLLTQYILEFLHILNLSNQDKPKIFKLLPINHFTQKIKYSCYLNITTK